MLAPYTGAAVCVSDARVHDRLARGYTLIDELPAVEPIAAQPVEAVEDRAPEAQPDETWTVSEIKDYAKRHGVKLPAKGDKAALLAAF